jgi:hypothetical protein
LPFEGVFRTGVDCWYHFLAEFDFPRNFQGISWENYFSKLFLGENSNFSQHFLVENFSRTFAQNFSGEKNGIWSQSYDF